MINKNKIIISNNEGYSLIALKDIIYLQGNGMYTEIFLVDESYIVSKNLKYFEDKLLNDLFIRIHQSYLVNINRIKHVVLNGKSNIITDTGIELPVSKKCKSKLKLVLEDNYAKN